LQHIEACIPRPFVFKLPRIPGLPKLPSFGWFKPRAERQRQTAAPA